MPQNNNYRDNGAIGALLDEYEKAMKELIQVVSSLSVEQMATAVDDKTQDPDCVSVASILNHVTRAAHNYVIAIRKHHGEELHYWTSPKPDDPQTNYPFLLNTAFQANVKLFEDYPDIQLEEHDNNKKIHVGWGQWYDAEQLMEHAIVHILRHRRQIERFKIRMGWQ